METLHLPPDAGFNFNGNNAAPERYNIVDFSIAGFGFPMPVIKLGTKMGRLVRDKFKADEKFG